MKSFDQLRISVFNKDRYNEEYKVADDAEWTGRRSFSPYGERHLPIIIQQQSDTAHMLDERGVPTYAPTTESTNGLVNYIDEDKQNAANQKAQQRNTAFR